MPDPICKNCKWWKYEQHTFTHQVVNPYFESDPDDEYSLELQAETEDDMRRLWGHVVRRCTHPDLKFYQRPDIDGAAVIDGSEYKAELLTGENFGCIKFETGVVIDGS